MSKFIDMTGQRYNRLTVVEIVEGSAPVKSYWKCVCDCGNVTFVSGANLRSGAVKSCGCLRKDIKTTLRHNMTGTRLYNVWASMKNRCYNPNQASYKNYGGRGIHMCEDWRKTPDKFFEWAMGSGYSDDLTIERIDVDKDYCPENCKWIPFNTQQSNRTSCRSFTHDGRTQNLTDWCKELGLQYKQIHNRIYKLGWTFERAISESCHSEKRNKKGR